MPASGEAPGQASCTTSATPTTPRSRLRPAPNETATVGKTLRRKAMLRTSRLRPPSTRKRLSTPARRPLPPARSTPILTASFVWDVISRRSLPARGRAAKVGSTPLDVERLGGRRKPRRDGRPAEAHDMKWRALEERERRPTDEETDGEIAGRHGDDRDKHGTDDVVDLREVRQQQAVLCADEEQHAGEHGAGALVGVVLAGADLT